MSKTHQVSIFVDVHDAQALHAHAMKIATEPGSGMSTTDAESMLGSAEEPNISGCLRMVFDPGASPPGTSILDSSCE